MSNARNLGNITAGGATGATTASVTTSINNLIDAAPGALNTLNELAAALGDDANFSTTVTNSIATKLSLAGGTMTGDLVINSDGQTTGGACLQIDNTNTSNTYPKAIEAFMDSMGVGQRHQILLGKDGSTNDTGSMAFYYAGDASSSNRLQLGLWGSDTTLNILGTGNVGIGTTGPSQNLHVSSTDHTRVLITGGTDKYAELQFENNAQKFAMGVQNDDKFFLYNSTGTSQVLTIDTSNNVGIGTQSPTALLQITPPNEHQNSFRIYRGGSSGYELNYLNMSLYQGNTVFNTTSTDSSGKRYLFQINGTEKVRIDQDGELLLGTTVQGRAAEGANRLTIANDSGHSGLTIRSGTGGSNSYGSINFSDSEGGTGEYAGSIYYAHGSLGDKLVLATTGSDRITMSGSGPHVGIGVQTSPTYALDIKGANFQDSSIRLERTDTGASNDAGIYFVNNQSTTNGGLGGLWFTNSYHSGNAYAMIRARTQETTSSGKLQFITSNGVVGNSTPAKMTINHAGDILYGGRFNFHVVSGFSAPNVAFQYDFYRGTYGTPIKVTAAITHWNSSYMSYTDGMYWGFNTAMTSNVFHSYNGGNGSWTISFPTNNIIRVRMNGDASYNYASGWYIKVEGNLLREYTSS